MNRSDVNEVLLAGDRFIRSFGYVMPPFAYWTPDEMKAAPHGEFVRRAMGWDITDYGQGKFAELGLFLFTVRNGLVADLRTGGGMVYAEKIMISRDQQVSPMHRHFLKTEDIINRGGGDLVLELHSSHADGSIDRATGASVLVDGSRRELKAGDHLRLKPGESVTLTPEVWHAFWGETGDVLIGEVSTVNDDRTDNWFEMEIPRYTEITEDTAPVHLLVSDYPKYLGT
ncbi:MAG: D-lyxose/D-mannose family sugar isomerase [Proteobacteria bacterium]|nr:D-lyxose/D-mannose family sugar isomerase [Pseudomonadota bacterium]